MRLENALRDDYGKKRNVNKKMFLPMKNSLIYNIV